MLGVERELGKAFLFATFLAEFLVSFVVIELDAIANSLLFEEGNGLL
jgi:hypothetical protein